MKTKRVAVSCVFALAVNAAVSAGDAAPEKTPAAGGQAAAGQAADKSGWARRFLDLTDAQIAKIEALKERREADCAAAEKLEGEAKKTAIAKANAEWRRAISAALMFGDAAELQKIADEVRARREARMEQMDAGIAAEWKRGLSLSDEQEAQVRAILARRRADISANWRKQGQTPGEKQEVEKKIRDGANAEIRALLNAEQQGKFDEHNARLAARAAKAGEGKAGASTE